MVNENEEWGQEGLTRQTKPNIGNNGAAHMASPSAGSASDLVDELLAQTVPTSTRQTRGGATAPPMTAPTIIGASAVQESAPSTNLSPLASSSSPENTAVGTRFDESRMASGQSAELSGDIRGASNPAMANVKAQGSAASFQSGGSSGSLPVVTPPTKEAGVGNSRASSRRQPTGGVPVIMFDSITKVYPAQNNKPALTNVSLKIFAGEFIFLVGHSGSGKSTFMRLINHEIVATRGRLVVAGEDVTKMRNWRVPYLRRNIGCVFQDFKLLPNKTAFENVAFALEVIGKSKHIIRTQVPEVLRLVGLEDKIDKYPDQLSGGEQQRVSIARAIVNRPPLLVCDEPTGNLDPQTSLGIMRLLDRINRTGTTIIVATHDRDMVDSLRKRVIALENGYLVRDEDKGVYGSDA